MGLFYTVHVKIPLEGITEHECDQVWWQTKDFDGWGDIEISPDGRLFEYEYEDVPEDDRPMCKGKPPEERTVYDKIVGCIRRVPLKPEHDKKYHGDLNFYGQEDGVKDGEWLEYNARFADGSLVRIEQVKANRAVIDKAKEKP